MKLYKYFNKLKIYKFSSKRFLLNLYVGEKNHTDTIHHFGSFVFWVVIANPNFHVNFQITNVIFLLISLVGNSMIFRESGNKNLNVPDFTINLLYIQENGKDQIHRLTCSECRSDNTSEARDHGCTSTKGASETCQSGPR